MKNGNGNGKLRFDEVTEALKAFRAILASVPGYKLPDWAVANVKEAADLYTEGKEQDAAEILRETEHGLRGSLRNFLKNSPVFFDKKLDELTAETQLDQDILDGLESGLKALEKLVLEQASDTQNFGDRISLYVGFMKALEQAPKAQELREENRRRKQAEELSRKQREKRERQEAEAQRQREQAAARLQEDRQARQAKVADLLADFR